MFGAATVAAAPGLDADSAGAGFAKDAGIAMGKDGGVTGLTTDLSAKDGGVLLSKDGGGWILSTELAAKDGGIERDRLTAAISFGN
jgi:hypothetical protein